MMDKYVIAVRETLQKTYIVTGENHEEAIAKIKSAYENGDIVLDYNDYYDAEIHSNGIASEADEKTFEVWED